MKKGGSFFTASSVDFAFAFWALPFHGVGAPGSVQPSRQWQAVCSFTYIAAGSVQIVCLGALANFG